MSGPDGLLGEEGSSQPTGTWLGDKAISVLDKKTHCSLDLTQAGEGRPRAKIHLSWCLSRWLRRIGGASKNVFPF